MNTELLKTFLEVARTRHFGQAADNLFLTQSAVSARIKQLEERIGVPLFTRERNNILLTASGERLLPHAENVLVAWQVALQEVGVPQSQSMQLTLGGTSNLWDSFLQRVLPAMMQHFPSLYVRTAIHASHELTRALLAGRIDIAVAIDCPTNVDLESRRIGRLELMMVSSVPGLTIESIGEARHVFVDWGTAFNLEQARLFEEPITPALHTGQAHIALEFLLKHGGTAFLPTAVVAAHLENGTLYAVEDAERASQDVNLVFSNATEKLNRLMPIIEWLENFELSPKAHA